MANGSGYFDHLPTIKFMGQEMPNLFFGLRIDEHFQDNDYFETIKVPGGMSPEEISIRRYGTKSYWWLVLRYNGIISPYDGLPLKPEEVEDYARLLANDRYGSPSDEEFYAMIDEVTETNRELRHIRLPRKETVEALLADGLNRYL